MGVIKDQAFLTPAALMEGLPEGRCLLIEARLRNLAFALANLQRLDLLLQGFKVLRVPT